MRTLIGVSCHWIVITNNPADSSPQLITQEEYVSIPATTVPFHYAPGTRPGKQSVKSKDPLSKGLQQD